MIKKQQDKQTILFVSLGGRIGGFEMKKIFSTAALLLTIYLLVADAPAQTLTAGRLGLGVNMGGQRIYCDKPKTGVGFGMEVYAKYVVNPRFFAIGSFGYGELSDGTLIFDKCTFSTDVLNLDLKAAVNLLTDGKLVPFGYLGVGAIWFHLDPTPFNRNGFFDATMIVGGGLETRLNSRLALNATMDYRFTPTDDLDGGYNHQFSKSNDGALNFRTGLTYYMDATRFGLGKEIQVSEKTPIQELELAESSGLGKAGDAGTGSEDELSALIEGIDQYDEEAAGDFAMEEYIKLKSRVDELNDSIGQKEMEIDELKSQLQFRKDRISELESTAKKRGGALASSLNADLSDFTASYEQALQNFYAKEFDAAIYLFNSLLETSPNNKLSSNCQYWIGECYFGKNDFANAVAAFEKVLSFDSSHKKDDALLMLGRSYIKLGDKQLAAEMFDQLMNDFPESEYFEKAQYYASSI